MARGVASGITSLVPLGISRASTSRVVVTSFCMCICPDSLSSSALRLRAFRKFRRDGFVRAAQRGLQRVPGQRRALDPNGVLAHAGKDFQLLQIRTAGLRAGGRCDEVVELLEER